MIGPSGIFLIETKNWSEQSQENEITVHQCNKLRGAVCFIQAS
ncbi:MAG: NERD domain-containing protein [Chitinophagaceae bacterium]|nr:NERD domain-containing protein [Chitinophagaceae bacterium]